MKNIRYLLSVIFLVAAGTGCSHLSGNRETLYQVSLIDALLEGVYDGAVSCGELKRHGDLGIGTFDALDGEMIVLNGQVYQVKADGVAYNVDDSVQTPFAAVTYFDPDRKVEVQSAVDYAMLQEVLDDTLSTENILYALRIEGTFEYIKTRSVPRQTKPYPRLVEIVEEQPIFEFHDIKGSIVGFRLPSYVKGINVPGYHLHFITEALDAGGHLLECSFKDITVEIDDTSEFFMVLPDNKEFYTVNLEEQKQAELDKVEK